MTDLEHIGYCLEIEVWQESRNTFISQLKYNGEILKFFGMTECKTIGTPMEVEFKLSTEDASPQVDEIL